MLQESIRPLALTPSTVTLELDLSKVGGVLEGTAANVSGTQKLLHYLAQVGYQLDWTCRPWQSVPSSDTSCKWHPWLGICDEGAYCTHKSSTSVL